MKSSMNSKSGIYTADFTSDYVDKPLPDLAFGFDESRDKRGLFLISTNSEEISDVVPIKRKVRSPKTNNRKTIITESLISHNGYSYSVNARKSGLYVEILKRMIEQFEIAAKIWSRVLVVRFDLHLGYHTADNAVVSAFVKRLKAKLQRFYGLKKIGYCWVREQEKSKAQHYHFVLFLEGRKVRNSKRVRDFVINAWKNPYGGHHVPTIKRPFYFGSRDEIINEVIFRISYLAKVRGKGYRQNQTKDYQCSRLKL